MSDEEYQFYDNYQPPPNVSKSLRSPEDDISYKAPYRDMLGILESEECWRPSDAIDSYTVLEKLDEWDEHERERRATPPKNARRVRDMMNELQEEHKLVRKIKPGRSNQKDDTNKTRYWKKPDEEISHPLVREASVYLDKFASPIDALLYRHDLIKISVFLYIVGSLVSFIHPAGIPMMYLSSGSFIVGHLLAYFEEPLTQ